MSTVTSLHGRDLLTLNDYSAEEITYLLDLAAELKAAKKDGREEQKLRGREIERLAGAECRRLTGPAPTRSTAARR